MNWILPLVPADQPSTHPRPRVTVLTCGTFDVFHVGHVRLLQRAAALGDRLLVGIAADDDIRRTKGRDPVYDEAARLEIVRACRYVDEVFVNPPGPLQEADLVRRGADIVVFGDDWRGRYDHFARVCRVVYLPRTPSVSTTAVIERLAAS